MRKLIFAALLAGTIATPAFAQDVPGDFTGFRLEGLAGYDKLQSGEQDDDGADTSDNEGDESIDGVGFGIGAGYDFDLGSAVAGVEAEYIESTAEQESDETLDGVNFKNSVEIGRDIYIGGRVGFKATPSTLLYAKAGYTNTSVEAAVEGELDDEAGNDRFELDTNVDGYRLGAGVEQLIGPNMYGKLEYRYSNYGSIDFDDDLGDDVERDIDLDRHQVMLGLGFRF